jgi:indole-3-glycerol phosphate synthase
MSTILDQIVKHKQQEVEERKSLYPEKLLERSIYFDTKPLSLKKYLLRNDLTGIIAEFKRRSPSKGVINDYADVESTTLGYMQSGASALSVLTDKKYFGGSNDDLSKARKFNFCPILRKDFIIDSYQIVEAKSIGADAILLIAAILTKETIVEYTKIATSMGLEVLLELHDADEIHKIPAENVLIGINNRNLKTMETDVQTSFRLLSMLPAESVKVAESGINTAETICSLKQAGFNGFLIGEYFMQQTRPNLACRKLINQFRRLESC